MVSSWQDYQFKTRDFFRSLGLNANCDVTVEGVRTNHDVDVVVDIEAVGFNVRWLVECKHWKSAVNQLHVLGFRQILTDVGADRGFILCETGFQSGAVEASAFTNVLVTSLYELEKITRGALYSKKLGTIYERVENARELYWELPKQFRIECGLRFDIGESNYSGAHVVEVAGEVLSKALRGKFPIEVTQWDLLRLRGDLGSENLLIVLSNQHDVFEFLEPPISNLERKLEKAYEKYPYDRSGKS